MSDLRHAGSPPPIDPGATDTFLTLCEKDDVGPAYDHLYGYTGRLRGYLDQRYGRFLRGHSGVEALIHELLTVSISGSSGRAAGPGRRGLEFWLWRRGLELGKSKLRMRLAFAFSDVERADGRAPYLRAIVHSTARKLDDPIGRVLLMDLDHGGRTPAAIVDDVLHADVARLYEWRTGARSATRSALQEELPDLSEDSDAAWFHLVDLLCAAPDLEALHDEEAWEEYVRSPHVPSAPLTESLIVQVQAGSRRARSMLVERYQTRVLRFVRRRLGERLRTELESQDVVQEVFHEALRSIDGFTPQGERAFYRWLCRVTRNRISNHARSQRKLGPTVHGEAVLSDLTDPRDESEQTIRDEEGSIIHRALQRLADDHRLAIHYRFFEQLTNRETATRMNRSEAAISMLVTRARVALAKAVDQVRREALT